MKIQKAYTATDVHVAGEAFRIIKDAPFIHYQSLQQLDEKFTQSYAEEVRLLLNEPRGFAGLNGCLVVPPFSREADAAVVFFNHEGTVPYQYGGAVAVITALLECGHLSPKESNEYHLETVNGVISVQAVMKEDEVVSVKLNSKHVQVIKSNVKLAGIKTEYSLVQADQLYAIFNKTDVPFELVLDNLSQVQQWGQTVNGALEQNEAIQRVVLLDDADVSNGQMKTVTFRRDNFIVRSPGFGTAAACCASLLSGGLVSMKQPVQNESIFNSFITVELAEQSESRSKFTFTSRGFITGMQTYVLDPTDPLAAGFLLK
ncbi:proline racemase family protein [Bacillus sp. S/N-304-OC-R1]|uniref:proline racemase family protein n=1 Tax=Bacillus sp. S/N-304-OC-R1 TaxID=2758034 RepID=UPI001C8D0FD1|nr:proline racemase family protein [Bacillus sp. S/N-304-OC-R1]MBY0124328.1 proline racemase family protein [Bacillus sp. S/N-304-OC-R1]